MAQLIMFLSSKRKELSLSPRLPSKKQAFTPAIPGGHRQIPGASGPASLSESMSSRFTEKDSGRHLRSISDLHTQGCTLTSTRAHTLGAHTPARITHIN